MIARTGYAVDTGTLSQENLTDVQSLGIIPTDILPSRFNWPNSLTG